MVKTMDEAFRLVRKVKICTIYETDKVEHTSLWEHVDLPDKQPGEKGWGQKVSAVWTWKNRLPAEYPNDIYYGKIKGGFAALMDMDYLASVHFPQAHKPVSATSPLAQFIFDQVASEPMDTGTLREIAVGDFGCTKSQFDTALKNLQISLNIVRLNEPDIERDTWLPFQELYPEIWERHAADDE